VWGLLGLPMGCVRGFLDNGVEERGGFPQYNASGAWGFPDSGVRGEVYGALM
jgi:hypothetical protein